VNGTDAALVGVDPETWTDMASLTFTSGALDGLESGGMAVDAQSAADAGLAMGDIATVLLQTGSADFTVTGIYEPAGAFSGFVVSSAALVPAGVEMGDSFIYAKAVDGADLTTVQADVTAALAAFPTVQVQSQAEFKEQITSGVNQILLVMVMLLSLAILIAILGIVNTLVLSVVERTREIGMLRAVGALRRQIRSMVVLEALVIAAYGAVVACSWGSGSPWRCSAPSSIKASRCWTCRGSGWSPSSCSPAWWGSSPPSGPPSAPADLTSSRRSPPSESPLWPLNWGHGGVAWNVTD
jgi:putative ABC transport system permease protein